VKPILTVCAVALIVIGQSGCSEPSQSVQYQDGRYAGKPDTPAWKSDKFDDNRQEWLKEIKQRTRLQSEYTRPGGA